jgi:hypothetical protein
MAGGIRTWMVLGTLWAGPLYAQEEPEPAPPARAEPPLKLVTDYHGVAPGAANAPKKRPDKPTLTWVGFQATEAGARVFAQVSASPSPEQELVGQELVVHLGELALGERNNLRPLDCRYFPTDVARVWAKRRGKKVELHVKFKDKATPRKASLHTTEESGLYLVLLDFGAAATP